MTSYPYPGMRYAFVEIPGVVVWVLYSIIPYPTSSVISLRRLCRTRQFCEICKTFISLPDCSVRLSYPYQTVLYDLYDFHTLPDKFCMFLPYRTYPHNWFFYALYLVPYIIHDFGPIFVFYLQEGETRHSIQVHWLPPWHGTRRSVWSTGIDQSFSRKWIPTATWYSSTEGMQ